MALDPEFATIPFRYPEAAEPKDPKPTEAATLLTPELADLLKLDESGANIVRSMLNIAHSMGIFSGIAQSIEIDQRLAAKTGGAR